MITYSDWAVMKQDLRKQMWPGELLFCSTEHYTIYGVTIDATATYVLQQDNGLDRIFRYNTYSDRFQEITGSDTAKNLMSSHFSVAKMEGLL